MQDCVFCRISEGILPAEIVLSESEVVAFLDKRPLFPGHVLVVPREHHKTLVDLPRELLEPLFHAASRVCRALEVALEAEGSFVAVNNEVSQSVAHMHVHVVPRRRRDGLRGFFWPRHPYSSTEEMASVASLIREALRSSR